jgi:hypothetical protein
MGEEKKNTQISALSPHVRATENHQKLIFESLKSSQRHSGLLS